ncbi:hypothetical protein BLS_009133, partial [Venturia inaequalis]
MSHLSIRERSTAKQEVDTLATQLLRLRTQIAEVEAAIFEVARLYSTLPLSLRKDTSRLKTSDPQILEACFFDAVETAQDAFWTGVVGQAKWVVLWIERGRDWAGGFGAVLEIDVASFAIGVVREELMRVESQVKQVNHATPEHLNVTSRRCFIGPIPKNWLDSHRKEWYKQHLHINYSSRAATFLAGEDVSRRRSVTGLDGPGQPVVRSFPQPEDLSGEEEELEQEGEVGQMGTPAVNVPSVLNLDGKASPAISTRAVVDAEGILGTSVPRTDSEAEASTAEAEASTAKAAEQSRTGGLLSPSSYNSYKAGTRMSKRVFGSPEDHAKSERSIYVDAPEFPMSSSLGSQQVPVRTSTISSTHGAMSSNGSLLAGDDASTSPLILHAAKTGAEDEVGAATEQGPDTNLQQEPSANDGVNTEHGERLLPRNRKNGRVNFDFPEDSRRAELKSRVGNHLDFKRPLRRVLRRRSEMEGRIIKMDRMLVRLDITKQQKLPEDFDENSGEGVITQTLEKWREFMVVCRQASKAEGSDFVLQIYKTR